MTRPTSSLGGLFDYIRIYKYSLINVLIYLRETNAFAEEDGDSRLRLISLFLSQHGRRHSSMFFERSAKIINVVEAGCNSDV